VAIGNTPSDWWFPFDRLSTTEIIARITKCTQLKLKYVCYSVAEPWNRSKLAAADQPFSHLTSAAAVVRAELWACAAPLTMKPTPGSAWNVAAIDRDRNHGPKPGGRAA
jgi:hypothetical protein